MSKLLHVLVLTLAVNFLAVAAGVGWSWWTGRLDRAKVAAIKAMLFPPSAAPAPATRPASPATRPSPRLDELLARHAGLPISQQLDLIRHSFDAQMAQIDRRQRELSDLQRQVELAKQQLMRDRAALDEDRRRFDAQARESARLAADKGFQDSLNLYNSLPGKQVKTIFMGLDDATVIQYLQAMEPRSAARITKEFKAPEEADRLKRILERMRQSQAASSKEPAASGG